MDLIKLLVFRPNKIEKPDGRPFYEYNIAEATLHQFEKILAQPRCTDAMRVQLLAFVASERFRRTYREGPWSWDDCGEIVVTLRERRGNEAFNKLISGSLKHWGLQLLPIHPRYLGPIVVYGGFPVAFLSGQSPLRAILRQLLRKRMSHGSGELWSSAELQITASNLPAAFKASPFFSNLCVQLIDAVADLVARHHGSEMLVDTLDEKEPGWQRKLPLSFDGEDAKHLVSELLNLASESHVGNTERLGFRRFLMKVGGQWKLSAQIKELPLQFSLPDEFAADLYRLQLLAEGELVRELTRLAKQRDGRYVTYPQLRSSDLALGAPFDDSAISLSMQVEGPEQCIVLPTEGGEPLDEEVPWVFVPSDVAAGSATNIAQYELMGTGSLRIRSTSAFLAVPSSWTVKANTQATLGELRSGADEFIRMIIRIEGGAIIDGEAFGDFTIRCNAVDDGPQLKLSGPQVSIKSPMVRHVFRGSPTVRVVPPIENSIIEWRSLVGGHQETWSTALGAAKGAVRYRVSDAQGPLAEARALVLPNAFQVNPTADALNIVLAAGWQVVAPNDASANDGIWRVPLPAGYELPTFDVLVVVPFSTKPILLRVPTFRMGYGFRRLLDGKSAPRTLSLVQLSEYVAYANLPTAFLRLYLGGNVGFPYRLKESDGKRGSRLPLAFIADDLRDLRYSSIEIDVPMSLEFVGQRPINILLPRLTRAGDAIRLQEVNAYRGDLRLRHMSSDVECVLESNADAKHEWRLPAEFPSGWSIVTVAEQDIRPLAVRLGDEEASSAGEAGSFRELIQQDGDSNERIERFDQHLSLILEHATDENSGEEIAYLQQWLLRFDDIPAEYLDLLKAITNAPANAVRLLAYSHGSPAFESMRAKLSKVPLYWHLCSKHVWATFHPWWRTLVGPDSSDLTERIASSLVDIQLQGMALDSNTNAMYRLFLRQKIANEATSSAPYRAIFQDRVCAAKQQWRRQVAVLVDEFHGAIFPALGAVETVANQLTSQGIIDIEFDGAPEWALPVLWAPMIAAWIAFQGGEISDDLRRQLAYSRHLGLSDFDRLYANTSMLLEQIP